MLEHSSVENICMTQKAFEDKAIMNATKTKLWHKCFKNSQESVESDPRLEGLQQAEHLRMLNVNQLQSTKFSD